MPSYRCADCGINYPAGYTYNSCPVHKTATSWNQDNADDDWEIQMAVLLEQFVEPETIEDMVPLVDTKVSCRDGAYFVLAWDVYAAVKARLKSGDLFRIGKQTFEVLEYLEEPREYWVRPFETTVSEDGLRRWLGEYDDA